MRNKVTIRPSQCSRKLPIRVTEGMDPDSGVVIGAPSQESIHCSNEVVDPDSKGLRLGILYIQQNHVKRRKRKEFYSNFHKRPKDSAIGIAILMTLCMLWYFAVKNYKTMYIPWPQSTAIYGSFYIVMKTTVCCYACIAPKNIIGSIWYIQGLAVLQFYSQLNNFCLNWIKMWHQVWLQNDHIWLYILQKWPPNALFCNCTGYQHQNWSILLVQMIPLLTYRGAQTFLAQMLYLTNTRFSVLNSM